MKRLVFLGILLLSALPAEAQRWSNLSAAPVSIDSLGSVLANGRNLSITYTGFEANLQTPADPFSMVRVQSFEARIDSVPADGWVQLSQQVNGAVHKDTDARVVVAVSAGGRLLTRVFSYGRRYDVQLEEMIPARVRWIPGQRYLATILVVVERRTPNAKAFVTIDTFDATVDRAAAPASRGRRR